MGKEASSSVATTAEDGGVRQLVEKLFQQPPVALPPPATAAPESRSRRNRRRRRPYLLLVEHSQSLAVRVACAAAAASTQTSSSASGSSNSSRNTNHHQSRAHVEGSVYRRAGLRTPAETAAVDWQAAEAWLAHVAHVALTTTTTVRRTPAAATSSTSSRSTPTTAHTNPTAPTGTAMAATDAAATDAPCSMVVWLQTLPPAFKPLWLRELTNCHGHDRVRVIHCGGGDCDWDTTETNDETSGTDVPVLASGHGFNEWMKLVLETMATDSQDPLVQEDQPQQQQQQRKAVVFLQSMTPLLLRYGFTAVQQILQELAQQCCLLVVPVGMLGTSNDGGGGGGVLLSRGQCIALERQAQAILRLQSGQANLVRQGASSFHGGSGGKLVRTTFPYTIHTECTHTKCDNIKNSALTATKTIVHRRIAHWTPPLPLASTEPSEAATTTSVTTSLTPTMGSNLNYPDRTAHREKASVPLTMNEGMRATPATTIINSKAPIGATPVPNIYMQDDDPEFDDMDEEDPDDDLDI